MPGEILVPERLLARPALFELFGEWKAALTPLANPRFDSEAARRRLESFYGVRALDGFGEFGRAEIAAAGALVDYVGADAAAGRGGRRPASGAAAAGRARHGHADRRRDAAQPRTGGDPVGRAPRQPARRRSTAPLTGPGARLLAEHLAAPLTAPERDRRAARRGAVLCRPPRHARRRCASGCAACPDIERALTRLSLGRGGPRDLAALRDALGETGVAARRRWPSPGLVPLPERAGARPSSGLGEHGVLVERLGRALAAELPLFARDGGFIAPGYSPELDQLRELRDDSRRAIAALQARYAEASGVASLRIRHNNVIGYYVEVSAANVERWRQARPRFHPPPDDGRRAALHDGRAGRTRKQDRQRRRARPRRSNCGCSTISSARSWRAAPRSPRRRRRSPCSIVAAAHAECAAEGGWVRPEVEAGTAFEIRGGRHPTVEAALAGKGRVRRQ